MRLKKLTIAGFKSFYKKTDFLFDAPITAIVGPNGSGKSNVAEAFRWALGEQSLKSLRGKRGEDLIWNGGRSGAGIHRASVSLTFDNHDRKFNLDFPELTVEREVYRDGSNRYLVNGSEVRLRDLTELLAGAALGSSGHHLISQGEADRILETDSASRRRMVEDALGLRLYQWKISESEKKLIKTEENKKQVAALRREIAPHLKFLKREAEKIKKADEFRRELKTLYLKYLCIEDKYLATEKDKLSAEEKILNQKIEKISLLDKQPRRQDNGTTAEEEEKIAKTIKDLNDTREKIAQLERQLGRIEGLIESKEPAPDRQNSQENDRRQIPWPEINDLGESLRQLIMEGETTDNLESLKKILAKIRDELNDFFRHRETPTTHSQEPAGLATLRSEKITIERELTTAREVEKTKKQELANAQNILEERRRTLEKSKQDDYELLNAKRELATAKTLLQGRWEKFKLEETEFQNEIKEGLALIDQEIINYKFQAKDANDEPRQNQLERKRQLTRLKIRLEDMNVDSPELLTEYQETIKRDEFLAKELNDLENSSTSLEEVIVELQKKINQEFTDGLVKINREFQRFFTLMFGGGEASLSVSAEQKKRRGASDDLKLITQITQEEAGDEQETGLTVKVNLPKKKIKGLEMLSGGERALTSIALLFAVSQVNPPPFLILDETDAALDEANSRKYGEMIENLAKHSQLILITHNRETMSRAQVIYGVTMGNDGVSRLLSIKFDDAVTYAK